MKRFFCCVSLVLVLSLPLNVQGQTLTETLIKNDPTKLIEEARKSGNIVQGAILFHQGKINCAKCHRETAESERIGPSLSRIEKEVTDVSIVESILQPSKEIKKGYETMTVSTLDGQLLSGIVVSQDDEKIILRSSINVDQFITIKCDDIDEIKDSKKSIMPDGLIDELKSRQQFLDLLRYVMDVRERGPISELAGYVSAPKRELSSELQGLVLMNHLNCVACHQSNSDKPILPLRQSPNLKWSAKWLNPAYLSNFIAEPHQVKSGSNMPEMLGHLDEPERKRTADSIVHYLTSIASNSFQSKPSAKHDSGAIQRGFELFHSVGCVACHAPRNELAVEKPSDGSSPLGNLTNKYDQEALLTFLMNPHVARPSGRMPNMLLSQPEARDLSSYLLQDVIDDNTSKPLPWKVDKELAKNGKQLFAQLQCAQCHTGVTDAKSQAATITPLDALIPTNGCLSEKQGDWPDFHLSEIEKQQIRSAIKVNPTTLTSQQTIDFTLTALNCTACHSRDGLGDIAQDRNDYFTTTNLNLGEQGRIPPTLTGVGAKLNGSWLRDVLVNHRSIRPYMNTRMPQFGEANVGHLIELFQQTDHLPEAKFATFKDQKETQKLGHELAGNQGLNCVACHTFQFKLSDAMPAVDLTEMAQRLKKDWFYQYMLDPQKFSPNTVMPSFWPDGKAIRSDIPGTPEFQVEALWQYLIDGRQANIPRGVIREPLEIVVTDEARMLRRSYNGIGKRGIGVGYPGGINLAYDAEQMRLAMIWKGAFVDPSGVWYGQGHGSVRPLGQTIELAKGPELDDLANPWKVDDGRPPLHKFLGYTLDKARRPTFRYEFDSIQVEDYCTEFTDPKTNKIYLRRSIKMTSPTKRDGLRFRLANDSTITLDSPKLYQVGNRLRIRIVSDQTGVVSDDKTSLTVPIELEPMQTQEIVLEYLWE